MQALPGKPSRCALRFFFFCGGQPVPPTSAPIIPCPRLQAEPWNESLVTHEGALPKADHLLLACLPSERVQCTVTPAH